MPEPEQPATPRKDRSLTGFYIATGVLAALVGLGAWLWTPLRIAHWERQAREYQGTVIPLPLGGPGNSLMWGFTLGSSGDGKATDAVNKLARVGPRSAPAFRRLLRHPASNVRQSALAALGNAEAAWALPLIVEASADKDLGVARLAVMVTEQIIGRILSRRNEPNLLIDVSEGRKNLLDWWEREGRAKYGGTGARP